jgi:hypothetical protein
VFPTLFQHARHPEFHSPQVKSRNSSLEPQEIRLAQALASDRFILMHAKPGYFP